MPFTFVTSINPGQGFWISDESPDGSLASEVGSLCSRIDVPGLYINVDGATDWELIGPGGGSGGGWTDTGTVVRLTTATDTVGIGTAVPARKLEVLQTGVDFGFRVTGVGVVDAAAIEGFVSGEANARWTITKLGDLQFGPGGATLLDTRLARVSAGVLRLDANGVVTTPAFELANGVTAAVSAADSARLRYNDTTGTLQVSLDGAAYIDVTTGSATGGWTDDGTVVRLTTASDQVGIGTAVPLAGSKLNVSIDDANNASLTDLLVLDHTTSGVVGPNIASAVLFRAENDAGTTTSAARISGSLRAVTAGTESGVLEFYTRSGGGALTANATLTADGLWDLPVTGASGGVQIGGDTQWFRGAANRMDLASGDTLNLVLGAFQIAGVAVFESDRDLAISLIPNADAVLDLGSASRQFSTAFAIEFEVRNAVGDAIPTAELSNAAVRFGPGGAGALDLQLRRTGVSTLTIDNNGVGGATIVPATDATGDIGTDLLRWNNVRAVTITSGAYLEEEVFADEFLPLRDKLEVLARELEANPTGDGVRHLARIVMLTARAVVEALSA